jgi:hypothetical protein
VFEKHALLSQRSRNKEVGFVDNLLDVVTFFGRAGW